MEEFSDFLSFSIIKFKGHTLEKYGPKAGAQSSRPNKRTLPVN